MGHQVLARKYRPKKFEEVIGQPHVVTALTNALNQQYLHHAYLFTGTRGVGKTTIARILSKCLNCETGITSNPCGQCETCQEIDSGRFPDLFEVDAASRTKVEDTRELLDNVQYSPTKGRYKVYLIDEVHMLSGHSFNALLKTLEEPPEHVKFLLATTDHQKLPATVLSRCLQFHLMLMSPEQIASHLEDILAQETIPCEPNALPLIGKAAKGSMRDALSLLDQGIAFGNGAITTDTIKSMLGTIEPTSLYAIIEALAQQEGSTLLTQVESLAHQGADFSQVLGDLLALLHQITVIQTVPNAPTELDKAKITNLGELLSPEDVQLFYQIGLIGQRDLPFAPTSRIGFEMTLLRMLSFYPLPENKSTASSSTATPRKLVPTTPPPTAIQTPTAPQKTVDIDNINDWHQILPELKLSGAALALAQNCTLISIDNTSATLQATVKQKPLVQPRITDRISQALNQHVGRTLRLNITIGEAQQATPAKVAEQKKVATKEAAKQSLLSDPKVKTIIETLDATLIDATITINNP